MAGLPLGQLPPALLERIVTKLAWRSYIRMQRTCRYMEELVRSSQHVKASTDWGVYIKFTSDEEPDGSWKYIMDVWIPGRDAPTADVSGLYGIRLDAYTVSIDILEDTLDILEKHRFTCEYLFIPPSDLTKDECSWIFDVLKPTKVKMHSEGSDRYEALLEYNQLKQVELWVNLNSEIELDLPLIKTYLNRFEDVRFCGMESKRNSLKESYLGFFRSLLEFLYSESLPNLRNVEITVMPMETINPLPEADEIREIFAKFNPTELVNQNYGYHSRCTPIFTFGYSDQFRVTASSARLSYKPIAKRIKN